MFNLFKKKKEEVKKTNYLPLKVREVVKETPDTVSIYFEQPEPFLDYKPGQFLTLDLTVFAPPHLWTPFQEFLLKGSMEDFSPII